MRLAGRESVRVGREKKKRERVARVRRAMTVGDERQCKRRDEEGEDEEEEKKEEGKKKQAPCS